MEVTEDPKRELICPNEVTLKNPVIDIIITNNYCVHTYIIVRHGKCIYIRIYYVQCIISDLEKVDAAKTRAP